METKMNTTNMSEEIKVDKDRTDTKDGEPSITEKDSGAMDSALTISQRLAICFAAGVVGALAVVVSSHVLFQLGLVVKGPIPFPIALKSPGIYQPLFWGGLWGILFGLFMKPAWKRLYLVGFLFVLAPMLATFLFFLPMGGAGFFGLKQAGPMFPLYVLLVNLPFGIVIALTARAIIGMKP
jgi:hypothetical protein